MELSIRDRFSFCLAPVNTREPEVMASLKRCVRRPWRSVESQHHEVLLLVDRMAESYARMGRVPLSALHAHRSVSQQPASAHAISALEVAYAALDVYVWLSRKFGPTDVFVDTEQAIRLRNECAAYQCHALCGRLNPLVVSGWLV